LTLNRYNYVSSSPLNYDDPSGHEQIIVSGDIHDNAGFPYQFVETALHDINERIEAGEDPSDITWMVIEAGYVVEDDKSKLEKFAQTAENLNISFVSISEKAEFINYINTKNVDVCFEECEDDRINDKITYMSIFSHAQTPGFSGGEENQISFAYNITSDDLINEDFAALYNIKQSDIKALSSNAFENALTWFYSCNAGTVDSSGSSFAQEWANKTGGVSIGIKNGRSEYSFINTTGNFAFKSPVFTEAPMDYVNGILDKIPYLEPSIQWEEKQERKNERKELVLVNGETIERGYSEQGSLNYPWMTSIWGDKDILWKDIISIENDYMKDRGWKYFEAKK
jgi:hypothetical protein